MGRWVGGAALVICLTTGFAWAGPSSPLWTPCTIQIQDPGTIKLGLSNYWSLWPDSGPSFPSDLSVEWGADLGSDLDAEFGVDALGSD